jgi:hypothetical protein
VRSRILILLAPIALLSACSAAEESAEESSAVSTDIAEEPAAERAAAAAKVVEVTAKEVATEEAGEPLTPAKVAVPSAPNGKPVEEDTLTGTARMPEFKYSHSYAFEAGRNSLGAMQDKHVAACEAMGPKSCKVGSFTQDLDGTFGASGSLQIYVATGEVNGLITKFSDIARGFGGERTKTEMLGSDVTYEAEQAQLQLRNALEEKARLEAILKSGAATIAEKRAAAEALAELNPDVNAKKLEVDQVASDIGYTKVDINYSSGVPVGIWIALLALAALIGFGTYQIHRRTEKLARPKAVPAGA